MWRSSECSSGVTGCCPRATRCPPRPRGETRHPFRESRVTGHVRQPARPTPGEHLSTQHSGPAGCSCSSCSSQTSPTQTLSPTLLLLLSTPSPSPPRCARIAWPSEHSERQAVCLPFQLRPSPPCLRHHHQLRPHPSSTTTPSTSPTPPPHSGSPTHTHTSTCLTYSPGPPRAAGAPLAVDEAHTALEAHDQTTSPMAVRRRTTHLPTTASWAS